MREIIVATRKETRISDEALYRLAEDSYLQWGQQGLHIPSLHRSFESFQQIVKRLQVFVALDAETGELLGMHIFRPNREKKSAYGLYLAVASKAKRQGVASQMLQYEGDFIRNLGYRYLWGRTTVNAEWSVRWHLKNGYRIVGYKRVSEEKYPAYVFRKQLVSSFLWDNALFCRCCYLVSYVVTCLVKEKDGQLTLIGRILKRIMNK